MSAESVNLDLLQQIGISAIVSGGVSAIVNHLFTMRQIKEGRETSLIEDQLKVYALYIYHVLKLFDLGEEFWSHEVHKFMAEDLKKTFDALDSAVTDKYYLLNPEEVLDLISIRKAFKYRNRDWRTVRNDLDSLHSRLTKEYNKSLLRYNQIVRKHSDT